MSWFRSLFDRHHARHVDSGLDFESELLSRAAERKAQLMRRAAMYEIEGLPMIAAELRACAELLTFERPLASLLLPTTVTSTPPEVRSNGSPAKVPARR